MSITAVRATAFRGAPITTPTGHVLAAELAAVVAVGLADRAVVLRAGDLGEKRGADRRSRGRKRDVSGASRGGIVDGRRTACVGRSCVRVVFE
jgi:hypothetical protein